jgi:hypothetical protein
MKKIPLYTNVNAEIFAHAYAKKRNFPALFLRHSHVSCIIITITKGRAAPEFECASRGDRESSSSHTHQPHYVWCPQPQTSCSGELHAVRLTYSRVVGSRIGSCFQSHAFWGTCDIFSCLLHFTTCSLFFNALVLWPAACQLLGVACVSLLVYMPKTSCFCDGNGAKIFPIV